MAIISGIERRATHRLHASVALRILEPPARALVSP